MKYRTIVVCVLMCLVGMEAKAYDFATRLSNGDSLFFNVTDASARQVCVVSPSNRHTPQSLRDSSPLPGSEGDTACDQYGANLGELLELVTYTISR